MNQFMWMSLHWKNKERKKNPLIAHKNLQCYNHRVWYQNHPVLCWCVCRLFWPGSWSWPRAHPASCLCLTTRTLWETAGGSKLHLALHQDARTQGSAAPSLLPAQVLHLWICWLDRPEFPTTPTFHRVSLVFFFYINQTAASLLIHT